jgi:uncharacterized protein YcaQ
MELSLEQARRLAIRGQHLSGPQPGQGLDGMREVLRSLRVLQIDPVNVVARSHLLVLWSRLGGFDRADLDTLLWQERWMFEYWAHAASLVLTEDYPIHQHLMRANRDTLARKWLAANDDFRRYVLDRLRESGPLPIGAIEDRAVVSWTSTGWTNGRNVDKMLDFLWKQGIIMVAGRDGLRRLWALADFPASVTQEELSEEEAVSRAAEHSLRALGVARARDVERHFTIGRYPGLDLERMAWARPVRVEGGTEQWYAHPDMLERLDEEWQPRTTLLSPFDNLICDRDRTQRLWDFTYRNEIYVPKHKRQYGSYVMPVLSGDRLTGRVVPRMDRRQGILVVEGVFPEPGAPSDPELGRAIESLAGFAGAGSVSYQGPVAVS